VVWVVRAGMPSLISVLVPGWLRSGDMMVDGGKRRDETGMENEMRVLCIEGVAIHGGPESCVGVP
jgi:hypothetical protein